MKKFLSRSAGEAGQAVIEMGLVSIVLIGFILFITDVGLLAWSHISATSAMREAARCAAVGGTQAAIETRIDEVGSGLATLNAVDSLTYTPNPAVVGGEVEVGATYSYDWITPVGLVPGLGGTLDFTRTATMRMESNAVNKVDC